MWVNDDGACEKSVSGISNLCERKLTGCVRVMYACGGCHKADYMADVKTERGTYSERTLRINNATRIEGTYIFPFCRLIDFQGKYLPITNKSRLSPIPIKKQ